MKPKEAEENLVKTVEKFLLDNGTVGVKRQDWPERLKKEKLTATARFKEDLGMDSLDTVELLLQIEDEYGVQLDAREFQGFKTLRDATKYFIKIRGEEMFGEKNPKKTSSGVPKQPRSRGRPKKPK